MTDKMEARHAIYSNIVDSITKLINAVEDLNINSPPNEDKAKTEECKVCIFKYSEMLQNNTEKKVRRNCYSMDELSIGTHTRPDKRQMSADGFRSSDADLRELERICPSNEVIQALKYLWSAPSIQEAYEKRNEFQLIDSASYFMNDLDRVCQPHFEPTDEDILRTRVKTTGIIKIEFEFRHLTVSLFTISCVMSGILYIYICVYSFSFLFFFFSLICSTWVS